MSRARPLAGAMVAALIASACADGGSSTDDEVVDTGGVVVVTTTTTPSSSSSNAPDTSGESTAGTTTTSNTEATTEPPAQPAPTEPPADPVVGEPRVSLTEVGRLDQPVDLVARPGDDTGLFVLEQPGRVVRLADDATVVADLTDRVRTSGSEQGLLGIEFSTDGALGYLNYTDGSGDTVVAEYPVAADGTFDVGAERVLITIDQPYDNHNGGDLARGPDGTLYIAMGDGGSGGDPERRASDPGQLLGSLLRIDPTPSGNAPYTVPADNPFAGGGGAPEVWAWGLRNPWRIAFDPVSGDLWIADVGQNAWEEVNRVAPTDGYAARGANFGWSAFEGTERFNDDVTDPGDTVMPVLTYGRDAGCSISGGEPYRGTAIPELAPAYVYSDYCSGTLWAFDAAGGRNLVLAEGVGSVSAVRAGPDRELYVLTLEGPVYRLAPGS